MLESVFQREEALQFTTIFVSTLKYAQVQTIEPGVSRVSNAFERLGVELLSTAIDRVTKT